MDLGLHITKSYSVSPDHLELPQPTNSKLVSAFSTLDPIALSSKSTFETSSNRNISSATSPAVLSVTQIKSEDHFPSKPETNVNITVNATWRSLNVDSYRENNHVSNSATLPPIKNFMTANANPQFTFNSDNRKLSSHPLSSRSDNMPSSSSNCLTDQGNKEGYITPRAAAEIADQPTPLRLVASPMHSRPSEFLSPQELNSQRSRGENNEDAYNPRRIQRARNQTDHLLGSIIKKYDSKGVDESAQNLVIFGSPRIAFSYSRRQDPSDLNASQVLNHPFLPENSRRSCSVGRSVPYFGKSQFFEQSGKKVLDVSISETLVGNHNFGSSEKKSFLVEEKRHHQADFDRFYEEIMSVRPTHNTQEDIKDVSMSYDWQARLSSPQGKGNISIESILNNVRLEANVVAESEHQNKESILRSRPVLKENDEVSENKIEQAKQEPEIVKKSVRKVVKKVVVKKTSDANAQMYLGIILAIFTFIFLLNLLFFTSP